MLTDLSFLVGAEAPYIVETSFLNARAFEILAPVWTETAKPAAVPVSTGPGARARHAMPLPTWRLGSP